VPTHSPNMEEHFSVALPVYLSISLIMFLLFLLGTQPTYMTCTWCQQEYSTLRHCCLDL
jgi:hypothetical protein